MKNLIISFLLLLGFFASAWGQSYEKDLAAADKAYKAGDKEIAKKLYLKAAEAGSAEGHFAIAYKYGDNGLFHFIEAAKKGHEKALEYALEGMLFRANSLKADPQKALDLYLTAKKVNPDLKLFDEEGTVKILKMCAEPKGFDADAFMKKYGVTEDLGGGYGIWELAEEASKGGRFGKPDPLLVFNLVMRGSQVPAELAAAVEDTYKNWKNGVVKEFNLCNYITSGMGEGYCAQREEEKAEAKRKSGESAVIAKWPKDHQAAFELLKKASADFIEARSRNEVDLSGSGRAAFEIEEEDNLKESFQKAFSNFENGKFPEFTSADFKKADSDLNNLYSRMMKLKDLQYGTVTPEGVKAVQRKWLPYREAWVKFGSQRYPKVSSDSWRTWLAQERMTQLADLGSVLKRSADGEGSSASFFNPTSVTVDNAGNVYVADMGNELIRKISPEGVVSTLAGGGSGRAVNGLGNNASFSNPWGVAVDTSGNVFVADSANYQIRKITPEGLVTTLAGKSGVRSSEDGSISTASFQNPIGIAVDPAGSVYVADGGKIRKISKKGLVTTFAGSVGVSDYKDVTGKGSTAYFASCVAVDHLGNTYISDGIFMIQKITPLGVMTTLAGSAGVTGATNGKGSRASFNYPESLAVDLYGNVYVADSGNNQIRKITPDGLVTTLAGSGGKSPVDGKGAAASIYRPRGIAVDKLGNIYVTDCNNQIRKITPDGMVTTFAGIAHDQ